MKSLSFLAIIFAVAVALQGCGNGVKTGIKKTTVKDVAQTIADLAEKELVLEPTEPDAPVNLSGYTSFSKIISEKSKEEITTKDLEMDGVGILIKTEKNSSVLELSGGVLSLPNKPKVTLKGHVNGLGSFTLKLENDEYNIIGYGKCVVLTEVDGVNRCETLYVDVYLRIDKEVYKHQFVAEKITYKKAVKPVTEPETPKTDDKKEETEIDECKDPHDSFCGQRGEYVGPQVTLENIPSTKTKAEEIKITTSTVRQAIGWYDSGSLKNATTLTPEPNQFTKTNVERKADFGTTSLINFIKAFNQQVAVIEPGQKPVVGNLSLKNGGRIPAHKSHQNGLDVDISLITSTSTPQNFVSVVEGNKISSSFKLKENWDLIKWINKNSPVARIFVHPLLKKEFCSYAKSQGEIESEKESLKRLQPEANHYNHMHVRLACPATDSDCQKQKDPTDIGC